MENRQFLTTRWSLVEAAGGSEGERARAALAELCAEYWYPLYAFVRRSGVGAEEAQDVVQGFFAGLIERGDLAKHTRGAGRFRGFLKVAVRNHLANVRDRERTDQRGGGRVRLAVDLEGAAERFAREPGREEDPERAFDRLWALELLERCLGELEAEYDASGRANVFAALKGALQGGEDSLDTAQAAELLRTSEGAVRVAVHRLRKRFGERLRARIADTVASPEEVEPELDELRRALGS